MLFGCSRPSVNPASGGPRLLFYTGPKYLLVLLGLYLLLQKQWKVFLGISLSVGLVAFLKSLNSQACPWDLIHYGGALPSIPLWKMWPATVMERPHCFPAGHASVGFCLFALSFKHQDKGGWVFLPPLFLGWILGGYQMAKGAHFFSHTLATMVICLAAGAFLVKKDT